MQLKVEMVKIIDIFAEYLLATVALQRLLFSNTSKIRKIAFRIRCQK